MTFHWQILAEGAGWRVTDVICTAGPQDRSFEEQHSAVTIAAVTEGTFQYRSSHGRAVLAPGTLLLGNYGHCFECGHEHGTGDRCLAFHYQPETWEEIVADVPRMRAARFRIPRLPAGKTLTPLIARAESAREDQDAADFEEIAIELAGAVAGEASGSGPMREPSPLDEKRISEVLRLIEAESDQPLPLDRLAGRAAMSPYHFLRSFRRLVGMTPHQYLLRQRLQKAAVGIRLSPRPISSIAFEAGFNDLSTFNHRFRRVMGMSPRLYRLRKGKPIA
jgi:AraC family transcriptional regulator